MVNFGFNLWAFSSIIIFWITMTGTQAWCWRSWFNTPIWLWISINVATFGVALLFTIILVYIFQQFLPFVLLLLGAIVCFNGTITLIQWLVLRSQIDSPLFWSFTNVLFGFFAWCIFQILLSYFSLDSNTTSILLSVIVGVVLGLGSSSLINSQARS